MRRNGLSPGDLLTAGDRWCPLVSAGPRPKCGPKRLGTYVKRSYQSATLRSQCTIASCFVIHHPGPPPTPKPPGPHNAVQLRLLAHPPSHASSYPFSSLPPCYTHPQFQVFYTDRTAVTVLEIATDVSGRLVFGPPKTRAARRTVGLPAPVAEELERHLATYAQPDPDGLVFTGPKGAALRATNFRRRIWGSAVRAAELDGLRIHDLRHTAVALWIAAGASPKEVARRAGHTSVKTVLDVYGHLYDEADVALRERLEAMFVPVVAVPTDSCGPSEDAVPSAAVRPTEETEPGFGEWGVGLPGLEPETSSL
jgi:hypothetical protein